MKLTAFTDYGLRVLIYLAAEPGRKATIAEISQAFSISEHHLVKVVHFLGRRGWVRTARGKGGGIVLGKAPEAISIGRVVHDTEGEPAPAECFETAGGRCTIGGCCRLKSALAEAVAAFSAVLDRYTLADIAGNRRELARLLGLLESQRRPAALQPAHGTIEHE
jgi:Rrf2 family nitric oxide-sensitive transcriptional repressor